MTETVERLMAEGLISMSEAAKMFGSCRSGAATHPATLTRKCLKGDPLPDGTRLKLEHVRVANRLMTSRQAVIRHITAMTAAAEPVPAEPARPAPSTPKARTKAATRAAEVLQRRGHEHHERHTAAQRPPP
jgi:hypothetical protein